MLVTRQPVRQQSRGPALINRANPLGAKVISYFPLSSESPRGSKSEAVTLASGGSYVGTVKGRSLRGDGVAGAGSFPLDLTAYSAFTAAFWLYWNTNADDDQFGFEHGPNWNTTKGFSIQPNESGSGKFVFGSSEGDLTIYCADGFTRPAQGAWHRVMLAMDRATPVNLAWVDGVAQSLTAILHTGTLTGNFTSASFHLFSRNEASLFGAGKIQDLTFFRGMLSSAEARADFENPYQILQARRALLAGVQIQTLRPISDVSAGAWTPSSGVDLYAMIDEEVADDADYDTTASASSMTVQLGVGVDPSSSAGHVVRYRIKVASGDITVTLKQGASTIASWAHSPAPTSFTTYAQTLSGGEADSITDYSDLRLTVQAS